MNFLYIMTADLKYPESFRGFRKAPLPPPTARHVHPSFRDLHLVCGIPKAPLCKGGWQKSLIFDWGIVWSGYFHEP